MFPRNQTIAYVHDEINLLVIHHRSIEQIASDLQLFLEEYARRSATTFVCCSSGTGKSSSIIANDDPA
ncbi:hypothetical protein LMG24235_07359 [Paraburkholderia sabiae]|nr:hypothetical protein LMG24235_07359 [Paraburkholderia sabiae]